MTHHVNQAGSRRPSALRCGRTILEVLAALLVGVGLMAVLVQVAQVAHQRVGSAKSAANLRTLALANLRYATDHGGSFCPAQDRAGLRRWHGGRATLDAKFDPAQGYLYPYLLDGGASLRCPLFDNYPASHESFESGAGDYGYNEMYIGGTPADRFAPEKITRVTNPARTIMFTDSALPRASGIQEYPFCEPYRAVNPDGSLGAEMTPSVHFRHAGLAQVAWCDGSVTAEPPTRLGAINLYGGDAAKYLVGWLGPAQNNGWWNSRQPAAP
jgi:prepilin-type processing-associated H-X9-DG protein